MLSGQSRLQWTMHDHLGCRCTLLPSEVLIPKTLENIDIPEVCQFSWKNTVTIMQASLLKSATSTLVLCPLTTTDIN